jgi:hypothetical protein
MADSTTLIAHKGARIVTREQASTDNRDLREHPRRRLRF